MHVSPKVNSIPNTDITCVYGGESKYRVVTKEIYRWLPGDVMIPMANCDTKAISRY